jgi:hypothetical protein
MSYCVCRIQFTHGDNIKVSTTTYFVETESKIDSIILIGKPEMISSLLRDLITWKHSSSQKEKKKFLIHFLKEEASKRKIYYC